MNPQTLEQVPKTVQVTSPAFDNGAPIPKEHTCQGQNVSPPLEFANVPREARTLALVIEDPDAPGGTFTHWTLWNLPSHETRLPEAVNPDQVGALEGENSFGDVGYGGPCPPSGAHRYVFKAYALDQKLDLDKGASVQEVWRELSGRVIARGELMGIYEKE